MANNWYVLLTQLDIDNLLLAPVSGEVLTHSASSGHRLRGRSDSRRSILSGVEVLTKLQKCSNVDFVIYKRTHEYD